jgi:hypothetical protein
MAADEIDEEYAALQYSFLDDDDDYSGEQPASESDRAKLTHPVPSEPDAPVVSSEPAVVAAPTSTPKPAAPAAALVKPPIPIIVPGMLKPTTVLVPTKSSNNSNQALDPFNLLVNHLPPGSNEQTLMNLFAPFGCVVSVKTFYDRQGVPGHNLRPRFGFVRFSNPTNAEQAMRALNGQATGFGAECLRVNHANLKAGPKNMPQLAQASAPHMSMMQHQQPRVCQHAQRFQIFSFFFSAPGMCDGIGSVMCEGSVADGTPARSGKFWRFTCNERFW